MPDDTGEHLVRDHFPVEVYAPHISPTPHVGRAFVTNQRVIVWTRDEAGTPMILLEETIGNGGEIERNRGSLFGSLHLDADGGPIHINKAGGCGCGSPLKALTAPVAW